MKLFALQVQEDIVQSLQLRNPLRLVSSFDRPNIHFRVQPLKESEDPVPIIARLISESREGGGLPCAIIYTLKRESADDIAARLSAQGATIMTPVSKHVTVFDLTFVILCCCSQSAIWQDRQREGRAGLVYFIIKYMLQETEQEYVAASPETSVCEIVSTS